MSRLQEIPATRLTFVVGDPGIPPGCASDPFAGLSPSLMAEGKAIGTSLLKANVGTRDQALRGMAPGHIQDAITRAAGNSTRALQPIYDDHRVRLMGIVRSMIDRDITRAEARLRSSKLIRESYERVREVARRASGLEGLGASTTIYREEEKWFRGAVREEIGYFHAFLEDVRNNRAHNVTERVGSYVKALRFMYESARIQAMPDRVLLYWRGPRKRDDPAVCEGCEYMMERSPFPKDMIPCVPRDGCVVDPTVLVSTRRGLVPISRVEVGDVVLTHLGRWRKVVDTFVHRARAEHRYVAIITPTGPLVVTDDHKVYTQAGWVEAGQAAQLGLCVLRGSGEGTEPVGQTALQEMWSARSWVSSQAKLLVADVEQLHDDEARRETLRALLGRRGLALRVPLSVGVGASARTNTVRGGGASQEWGLRGRPVGELGVPAGGESSSATWGEAAQRHQTDVRDLRGIVPTQETQGQSAEILFDAVSERRVPQGDPVDLFGVWELVQAESERGGEGFAVGEAVLLASVLREGLPLYDIAVEEDRSFVVNGLVIHNSTPCLTNCRHRIFVRVVQNMNDVVRRRQALGKRESMLRELNERKRAAGLGRSTPKVSAAARNPFKDDKLTKHVSRPIRGRR